MKASPQSNLISSLKKSFFEHLTQLYTQFSEVSPSVQFSLNTEAQQQEHGDASSNASLVIARALKTSPRTVAQHITETFRHPSLERMEIAGPGFINFFLTSEAWHVVASELYEQQESFFKSDVASHERYNVEFVSANPTGPLHVGHGRGGIIGDVISTIISFIGTSVTKEFYINDAGIQIQLLGQSLKTRYAQEIGQDVSLPENGYQGEYLKELARELVSHDKNLLDKPDTFFAEYGKELLLKQLKKTLENYHITFDVWFSEKTLHASGAIARALEKLQSKDLLYEQDGALWFRSSNFGDDKDRVVKKQSGELTYVAADIAYLMDKIDRGFTKLIMILGQDHHGYVNRLKAVLKALEYNPDMLNIILYQLVTIKESGELIRMSKRTGKIVSLQDIIETVGVDVARFFYLYKKADAHLDFDLALALKQTDENPVYYIQYALVRIKSIEAKAAHEQYLQNITPQDLTSLAEDEILLLKKLISLKELLSSLSHNYQTHLLAHYTIELAQLFHRYYSAHRVIDAEHPEQSRSRLFMLILIRQNLELCFKLLGISAPDKM